jgi:hypothetical protein
VPTIDDGATDGPPGSGIDFIGEQERLDSLRRVPAEMKASGARVEVARGEDWSFMAWRSPEGFCLAYASRQPRNSCRSCGRIPGNEAHSRCLVATLATPTGASDGLGAIVGIVMPQVARIDVELADGRVESADTLPAPAPLDTDLRTFLIRTPLDALPVGPGFPPLIRAYRACASDGQLLERLALGASPDASGE